MRVDQFVIDPMDQSIINFYESGRTCHNVSKASAPNKKKKKVKRKSQKSSKHIRAEEIEQEYRDKKKDKK